MYVHMYICIGHMKIHYRAGNYNIIDMGNTLKPGRSNIYEFDSKSDCNQKAFPINFNQISHTYTDICGIEPTGSLSILI